MCSSTCTSALTQQHTPDTPVHYTKHSQPDVLFNLHRRHFTLDSFAETFASSRCARRRASASASSLAAASLDATALAAASSLFLFCRASASRLSRFSLSRLSFSSRSEG